LKKKRERESERERERRSTYTLSGPFGHKKYAATPIAPTMKNEIHKGAALIVLFFLLFSFQLAEVNVNMNNY